MCIFYYIHLKRKKNTNSKRKFLSQLTIQTSIFIVFILKKDLFDVVLMCILNI